MRDKLFERPIPAGLHGRDNLEKHLISEYLLDHGVNPERLPDPLGERERQLLVEAARYATARLTKIEAEARLIQYLHEAGASGRPSPDR